MREIERDILLASSGELGPFKRARLGWRLARDPEARRLAETLGVAAVMLSPQSAERRWRNTMGWLAAGSVATAAIGLAFVLHGALRGRPSVDSQIERASAPPLSETTGWLLFSGPSFTISSGLDAAVDAGFEAPPLPPWSAGLDETTAIDLIPERSR